MNAGIDDEGRAYVRLVDYQPPRPIFDNALLAYHRMRERGSMTATVERDPLGPVNCIVSLWRSGTPPRRIKAVLYPVRAGSEVTLSRYDDVWYVTVDGRHVIAVPAREVWADLAARPRPPWHRRVKTAVGAWVQRKGDALAARLGYVPDGQVG